MPESKQYRRVQAEQAGVDVERLQKALNEAVNLRVAYIVGCECHTDEARNAIREAIAQLADNVIPVLSQAVSDIEELYHVSREGAVDSEE